MIYITYFVFASFDQRKITSNYEIRKHFQQRCILFSNVIQLLYKALLFDKLLVKLVEIFLEFFMHLKYSCRFESFRI